MHFKLDTLGNFAAKEKFFLKGKKGLISFLFCRLIRKNGFVNSLIPDFLNEFLVQSNFIFVICYLVLFLTSNRKLSPFLKYTPLQLNFEASQNSLQDSNDCLKSFDSHEIAKSRSTSVFSINVGSFKAKTIVSEKSTQKKVFWSQNILFNFHTKTGFIKTSKDLFQSTKKKKKKKIL